MKAGLRGMLVLGACLVITEVIAIEKENLSKAHSILEEARQKIAAGDKEKAALLYQQVLQIDNTNKEACHELATIVIQSQVEVPYTEQSDVMTILEDNMAEPTFPAAHFSLTFLNNGALTADDRSMNPKVLLALQKLQNNNNGVAVKIAEALQNKYPQHPVPYNLLGLAWQGKGNPSKAHEFFEKALALKENFHAARLNLAELELHLGEFSAAHEALDTVLKSDARNRRASLVKAHLYTLEGQSALAKVWYAKASEEL